MRELKVSEEAQFHRGLTASQVSKSYDFECIKQDCALPLVAKCQEDCCNLRGGHEPRFPEWVTRSIRAQQRKSSHSESYSSEWGVERCMAEDGCRRVAGLSNIAAFCLGVDDINGHHRQIRMSTDRLEQLHRLPSMAILRVLCALN
eukprot:6164736-Amphidinium_carterae.1